MLKNIFSRYGIPEVLINNNSPQYDSSEMKGFASYSGFQHTKSIPYYPQSNGQAEWSVKTVKALRKLANDPRVALLSYWATPFP